MGLGEAGPAPNYTQDLAAPVAGAGRGGCSQEAFQTLRLLESSQTLLCSASNPCWLPVLARLSCLLTRARAMDPGADLLLGLRPHPGFSAGECLGLASLHLHLPHSLAVPHSLPAHHGGPAFATAFKYLRNVLQGKCPSFLSRSVPLKMWAVWRSPQIGCMLLSGKGHSGKLGALQPC